QALAVAGPVDEDPPHRLRRSAKKVPAAIPLLLLVRGDQPDVSLVHQGRGLQRLPGAFLTELLCGEFSQLVVDERQERVRGARIALLDGREDLRDLVHWHCRVDQPGNDRKAVYPNAEEANQRSQTGMGASVFQG